MTEFGDVEAKSCEWIKIARCFGKQRALRYFVQKGFLLYSSSWLTKQAMRVQPSTMLERLVA